MGKYKGNKDGFSVVEVVIVLVVVAILAVLGFILYKNIHKASSPASQATSHATPSTTLAVKEWGVQFKLVNPTITDAYYTAPSIDQVTGLDSIGLGTKATNVEIECGDGVKTQQTTIDTVYRSTDKDKVITGTSSEAMKAGDYYYSIAFEGGPCDAVSASAPRASDVSKKFIQNFEVGNLTIE